MIINFLEFLNENNKDIINIKFVGDIKSKDLVSKFNYISKDDVDSFCRNSPIVKEYKLKIPFSLNIMEILEEHFDIRFLDDPGFHGYQYYWINMGNGLTSIIEENDEDYYTIYSGEKRLDQFLEIELELILNTKQYNL